MANSGKAIARYGLSSGHGNALERADRAGNGVRYPEASPDGHYAVWQYFRGLNNPDKFPLKNYIAIARRPG